MFRLLEKTLLWLMVVVAASHCCGQESDRRIAFWNVENFFDTYHDSTKADLDFTPEGQNHWTYKRYEAKRNKIYKVIAALHWPAVMGMAEVENDHVLTDLCQGTPLRQKKYAFVHYESPDSRGVDCALIYRKDLFRVTESRSICVSDSAAGFFTRDILLVGGMLGEDTCFFLVNHWPSKLGGATADTYRMKIARRLLSTMDSLQHTHPGALILAMGDFNASPDEESVKEGLQFRGNCTNPAGFHNLVCQIPAGTGSYKYRDTWSCIDQMISNKALTIEIFTPDFLLMDDTKYLGKKLFRTYIGMQYLGGFSDHLPLITTIP